MQSALDRRQAMLELLSDRRQETVAKSWRVRTSR